MRLHESGEGLGSRGAMVVRVAVDAVEAWRIREASSTSSASDCSSEGFNAA
jgi:hypothetical protein